MSYVFEIEVLHAIARQGVGKAHDEMVRIVVEEAARAYPAHIDANPPASLAFQYDGGSNRRDELAPCILQRIPSHLRNARRHRRLFRTLPHGYP